MMKFNKNIFLIGTITLLSACAGTASADLVGKTVTATGGEVVARKNVALGYAGLDASARINPTQLPAIAITDTYAVATQDAMLLLDAQTGDVAVRTDLSKSFILTNDSPTVLGSWQELQTPSQTVSSIFTRTGAVTSQAGDYTATQVVNTPAGNVAAVTTQAAIDELDTEKAALAGATFTGNVTPTGRMIMPVAQVDYFSMTGVNVNMALSDGTTNMVAVDLPTTALVDTCFDNGGSNNGMLRYYCATTKFAYIAVTASFTPNIANATDLFVTGIARNGGVGTTCKSLSSASGTKTITLNCIMSLSYGDTISFRIGDTTATGLVTMKSLHIQALMM